MSVPKLLVHICCAPCLIAPYQKLKAVQTDITGYWYNPNIHPYTEYVIRRDTLKAFAEKENLPMLWEDDYDLEGFLQNTAPNPEERCAQCYRMRLLQTVLTAKHHGFTAFTSTLLYSKYQKHDLIREIVEGLSAEYGIAFYYEDWRPLWQEGIELSKQAEMYRQPYCGCIYSEKERYHKRK